MEKAMVYTAEWYVLRETFVSLKIRGLYRKQSQIKNGL